MPLTVAKLDGEWCGANRLGGDNAEPLERELGSSRVHHHEQAQQAVGGHTHRCAPVHPPRYGFRSLAHVDRKLSAGPPQMLAQESDFTRYESRALPDQRVQNGSSKTLHVANHGIAISAVCAPTHRGMMQSDLPKAGDLVGACTTLLVDHSNESNL